MPICCFFTLGDVKCSEKCLFQYPLDQNRSYLILWKNLPFNKQNQIRAPLPNTRIFSILASYSALLY